ncbi:MAG: UDP-N-acetylmuramoyl-L-alanine--D-glutamate ligase [Deltaproteobacteria bacterium]|nr:UDP-N-acetylmuramoyl-L-alanine--D-glutamate ligase [Deltaproteobacteria bacterium]
MDQGPGTRDLKNKKVLVVGFGKSGQAVLRFLLKQGVRPAVTDLQNEKVLAPVMKPFKGFPVDWFLGSHPLEVFESADLIVVSPGVPINTEPLKTAKQKGIPVISELELALRVRGPWSVVRGPSVQVPSPWSVVRGPSVIAVTGTNGKTTTATLIHHLLTAAGKKSLLAGNVGRPLIDCLDALSKTQFLVLEVSSYQMETTPSLKPDAALLLNITEDHLHWHESFAAYAAAKAKLIQQAAPGGSVIYNQEDSLASQIAERIPARRFPFSSRRQLKLGGWVDEGKLYLKTEPKSQPKVFDLNKTKLKGIPGWENMLAALLAVSPYVEEVGCLQKGLETFVPLPHRMQIVKEKKGVTYINDSKATNVGAAVKALAGVAGPVLWIAGGQDKGGSYDPLKEWVKKKSAAPIFWGRRRQNWEKFLRG